MTLRGALVIAACAVSGCQIFQVPGLAPLVGPPPEAIDPEPLCGMGTDVPHPTTSPIVGAADLHLHQFAEHGFGGQVLWGRSFHEDGIEAALAACGPDGLCIDDREVEGCKFVCGLFDAEKCRAACELKRCTTSTAHGHFGITDPVGAFLDESGHFSSGFPRFQGWPHWNTHSHQQVYHRWLRRAFDGGLKLVVMLAVTNEALCEAFGGKQSCNDMDSVDEQLRAARELERHVDWENDCEVNGNGWYRIAESAADARSIIEQGAMAVVLGAEVDSLFDCSKRGTCTPASIQAEIDHYKQAGLRHVFPIHLFDNAFGGAAAYSDIFNAGNAFVNFELLQVENCSNDGYAFQFGKASVLANEFIATMTRTLGIEYPRYRTMPAHCNRQGLTVLGRQALKALMDAGMIIDVDHMSKKARASVLDLARDEQYTGLVSGHSGFVALYKGEKKHEGQLTELETKRLIQQGGLLAPIPHHGATSQLDTHRRPDGPAPEHTCGNSAESFAQGYLYAVDAVKELRPECRAPAAVTQHPGACAVGIGTDLNGLAGMPAPRFGPYACGRDGKASGDAMVSYPFEVFGGAGVKSLPMSKAGSRRFDINVDGYAHAGMFPDFVEELRKVGVSDDDLRFLFNSAEAYIQLWERVEARAERHQFRTGGTTGMRGDEQADTRESK